MMFKSRQNTYKYFIFIRNKYTSTSSDYKITILQSYFYLV